VTEAERAEQEQSHFRQTLVRNTFWYGVVTVVGLAAGLLMSVVLARGLGPSLLGDYSYLLWVTRAATAVATLGFAVATTRYTAAALSRGDRGLAGAYLRTLIRRQSVTALLVGALATPLVLRLAPLDLRWALLVAVAGLLPVTLEAIYAHAAYGAQRYDLTTQVSTVKMTLSLGAAVAVVALSGGVLGLTVAGTLVTVVSCLLQRRHALQLYPDRSGAVPPDGRRELIAYLTPLSAVAVLDTIVWDRSELLFLRLHASSADIAFYSIAFGLATRAMVAPEVVAGTLLPALASLHGRGAHEEFRRIYREALRLVALVGVPLAAVGGALAPGLIVFLYGRVYGPVAPLLGPLLAVALVGVMRQVAWSALRASGDRRWALNATWSSAVINVALAAWLIPRHGTWGAVAANASAQLIASTLAFVAVAVRERCGVPVLDIARVGIAGLAGWSVTHVGAAGARSLGHLALAGVAGFVAFGVTALLLGAVGARDWRMLTLAVPAVHAARLRSAGIAAAVVAVIAALYGPALVALVRVWSTNPYYSYGFLVPFFSAWVVWDHRHRFRGARPELSAAGVAFVVAGLGARAIAEVIGSLTLAALSLPLVLGGLALLLLGRDRGARLAFPVAFLAFMAPLPDSLVPSISAPLQHMAASFATHALVVLGVPSVRDGLLIHLPDVSLEVTEACNGLRFLLAMLVIGTAFAWQVETRARRRIAIVALALAVAVAANLVRVTGTGWLAHHYGSAAASGFFHIVYGKVVYLAVLVPFVLAVIRLRRPVRVQEAPHGG